MKRHETYIVDSDFELPPRKRRFKHNEFDLNIAMRAIELQRIQAGAAIQKIIRDLVELDGAPDEHDIDVHIKRIYRRVLELTKS